MSTINVGDTVKVLAHRNAYDEDISTWRTFPFKTGETFAVGAVQEGDSAFPCPLIFPVGENSEFWRADDLEVVERGNAPTYADRLKVCRAQGIGLIEARKIIKREDVLAEIDAARSINDLKAILRQVVQQC